ncbi:MAG: hypothetical protein M3255_07665, partial [Pseudomonadota bacterium]|nr:hypothetical protein [Pseudomonadota bacterium]
LGPYQDADYERERGRYYKIFETLADITIQDSNAHNNINRLLGIKPMGQEWIDYPFIFYRTMARICKINTLIYAPMPRLLISSLVNTSTQQAEARSFNSVETRLPKGFSKRWGSNLVLLRSEPSVYIKK